MTDLAAQLQQALGDAYALERELGGGGMSRLFVATERSLNRLVVVKVLPPELTSEVSAARFKQEIEVAAKLQHPHIVPILATGSSNDLLYYIMPYVDGESLRHRLSASGRLPVPVAVRILSEVAAALGYAHRQGIVHRDIKPENILLADDFAVLADFGVARAIMAARAPEHESHGRLTLTGTSVGTPSYMAPEQIAADDIDARADVYALGVVGYEMLAGQLPFIANTPQQMLAAHLTQPAPPVTKLRPETPSAVNAAIARALEKEPAKRFASADALRAALGGAPPAQAARRITPRTISILAIAATLVAVVLVGLSARSRRGAALDANLVAVAPFDVPDADLRLWHEGMVDVLSRDFDGAGPLRTVPPTLVLQKWSGHGDRTSAAMLGKETGARLTVYGTLVRAGADSLRGSASIVDASSGQSLGSVEREESVSQIGRLADSLTVGLLRELGTQRGFAGATLPSVGTRSFVALKAFLQGEQFFRASEWDSASASYLRAIAADSEFSIALVRESDAIEWRAPVWDSMTVTYALLGRQYNHGLAPRDSLLIDAVAAFKSLEISASPREVSSLQRQLFGSLAEALRRYPNDSQVWYMLAQARRFGGWGADAGIPEREVLRTYDRAIALDSSFTPSYLNAIAIAFRYGAANGRRYLAAYLAHQPAGVASAAMQLAYRLTDPAKPFDADVRHVMDTASVQELATAADALSELGDSAESGLVLRRTIANRYHVVGAQYALPSVSDSVYQQFLYASTAARRGHAVESMRRFPNSALAAQLAYVGAVSRPEADSLYRAQHMCEFCTLWLQGSLGDTNAMRGAADSFHAATPDDTIEKTGFTEQKLIHSYLTLARRDTTGALSEFVALADSGCHVVCAWTQLTQAQLLESRGRYEDAARVLDRVGALNELSPVVEVLLEFERGRVAEKLSDKPRAHDAYAYVASMWQNGDPPFRSYVAQARAGLRRVGGDDRTIPISDEQTAH